MTHVAFAHEASSFGCVVCLTAPPALLYAIPVERFFDAATARNINTGFLAFVAAWRVALLAFYLMRWHN